MKNIILIFTILIMSCNGVLAQTYKQNMTYNCNYQIDKYTTGSCVISTDSKGEINSSVCGPNAPSLDILLANNQCKLTPQKIYQCKYPNGQCKVNLIGEQGHEISCHGTTPDIKNVYQQAISGKCIPAQN